MIAPALPQAWSPNRGVTIFSSEVRDAYGRIKKELDFRPNLRTTTGLDWQAALMGGGVAATAGNTGTATTAPTATTATLDGAGAPGSTSKWNGQIITMGAVWGVILSNTNVSSPVVTVDMWHDPTNPGGAAATTPAAGRWIIAPGQAPMMYLALTADSGAPAAGDTTLTSEVSTNGLARAFGTYAHTGGVASFTLSKTFTCTGGTTTINKEAVFCAQNGGVMAFESAEPSPPTLINGDSLNQVITASI